jgi:Zn-dependent peptidase ImmA (M78 family)
VKLPNKVWSQLGAIPVKPVKMVTDQDGKDDDDAFGFWNTMARDIQILTLAATPAQLATLFHEMAHVALHDAGVAIGDDATEERVCDAIGTYMAGSLLAGFLALRVPKE